MTSLHFQVWALCTGFLDHHKPFSNHTRMYICLSHLETGYFSSLTSMGNAEVGCATSALSLQTSSANNLCQHNLFQIQQLDNHYLIRFFPPNQAQVVQDCSIWWSQNFSTTLQCNLRKQFLSILSSPHCWVLSRSWCFCLVPIFHNQRKTNDSILKIWKTNMN